MVYPSLKVGAKVSIVSQANVRYEGTLVDVDVEKLKIALCDVQFFGTESRTTDLFIAGQTRVYPFVVFESADIKELIAITEPTVHAIQCHAYALNLSGISPPDFFSPIRRSYERDSAFGSHQNSFRADQAYFKSRLGGKSFRSFSRQSTQYLWRIPRIVDYVSRSGDPNELPVILMDTFAPYEQDYDFEKYNKLFVDLCRGQFDLNLAITTTSDSNETGFYSMQDLESSEDFNRNLSKESSEKDDSDTLETSKEVEDSAVNVSIESPTSPPSKGAIPKIIADNDTSSKLISQKSTAYDKSKSFFDTVSCSSIYPSGIINPNWRAHNTETFGVPMICHQRRQQRVFKHTPMFPINVETTLQQKPEVLQNTFYLKSPNIIGRRHHNNFNIVDNNNNTNHHFGKKVVKTALKKGQNKEIKMPKKSTPIKKERKAKQVQTEPIQDADIKEQNDELKNSN